MMTIVSAPGDLIVATNDGVGVRFGGIESISDVPVISAEWLGKTGIRLYFQGIRSEDTIQRDIRHDEEMLQWVNLRKSAGAEATGDAPAMPGQLVLGSVGVNISDDIGTSYRMSTGQVAGSGSNWEATWVYLPEPPSGAQLLTLEFTLDDEPTGTTCHVKLH